MFEVDFGDYKEYHFRIDQQGKLGEKMKTHVYLGSYREFIHYVSYAASTITNPAKIIENERGSFIIDGSLRLFCPASPDRLRGMRFENFTYLSSFFRLPSEIRDEYDKLIRINSHFYGTQE